MLAQESELRIHLAAGCQQVSHPFLECHQTRVIANGTRSCALTTHPAQAQRF